ncbi:MAG: reverse transcriptase domain-containing protein [Patescibacteria group bacterium]
MKKQLPLSYPQLISTDNLLAAWQEFVRGKRGKIDVQAFSRDLMDNIRLLHNELESQTYQHGGYFPFTIADPKPRRIHKAAVRDRLVHHAVYRRLYPFFDRTFIPDSYSCRRDKGTHKALNRFDQMANQVSRNHTKTCWVLKLDIRQFFASIDQKVLLNILAGYIPDKAIRQLLGTIIESFATVPGRGLPLGNLTSQLFVNVYMNEFDQFAKHQLKARHYLRYADDFVLLSQDRRWLEAQLPVIQTFLQQELKLAIHADKVVLQTIASGVDYLGWVHFPYHRVLRTTTKRRMLRNLRRTPEPATFQSYLGLLGHGATLSLQEEVQNLYWLLQAKQ